MVKEKIVRAEVPHVFRRLVRTVFPTQLRCFPSDRFNTGIRRQETFHGAFSWNSGYSVGVKTIDGQHTKLFDMLNDLHSAMMSGKTQGVTGKLLHKLVDYTREHFAAEEAMMASAKFPEPGHPPHQAPQSHQAG